MSHSPEEIDALTRYAGIPTSPERLPTLIREAAAIASLITDLDGIPVNLNDPADSPFDPATAWNTIAPEHHTQ